MEVGDWITLAAVMVALGLGVASILHTSSMQKGERRERILNEIIEWAIQSSECDVIPETSAWISANNTEKQRLFALGTVILERNKVKETWGRSNQGYIQCSLQPKSKRERLQ